MRKSTLIVVLAVIALLFLFSRALPLFNRNGWTKSALGGGNDKGPPTAGRTDGDPLTAAELGGDVKLGWNPMLGARVLTIPPATGLKHKFLQRYLILGVEGGQLQFRIRPAAGSPIPEFGGKLNADRPWMKLVIPGQGAVIELTATGTAPMRVCFGPRPSPG